MQTLKRSECAVLSLVLKGKWYDMIESGVKKEEYRDDTPYWNPRISHWFNARKAKVVAFSRGRVKPTLFFRVRTLTRTNHRAKYPEWGEPETTHWIIELGERINLED